MIYYNATALKVSKHVIFLNYLSNTMPLDGHSNNEELVKLSMINLSTVKDYNSITVKYCPCCTKFTCNGIQDSGLGLTFISAKLC